MIETPAPKKHRITSEPAPKQMVPLTQTTTKPEAGFNDHLSPNEQAKSQGLSIALEAMTRMGNSLNIVNSEVWDMLNSEEIPSLLELGARTQAVVSLILCRVPCKNLTLVCLSHLFLL